MTSPVPTDRPMTALRTLAAVLVGALVAALGTVAHRGHLPWGLVGALVLVVAAGVTMRAWGGWWCLLGFALGVVPVVLMLARTGPGGDVLVPDGATTSWVWLLGAPAAVLVATAAPRRWFDPRPRVPAGSPLER